MMTEAELTRLVRKLSLGPEHQDQESAVAAAVRTLLLDERHGVVLADEVGFGKTYEALGVMTLLAEYYQHQFDRVLVLCKSSLLNKWHEEITTERPGRGFRQYVAGVQWLNHPVRQLIDNVYLVDRRQTARELRRDEGLRGRFDEGLIQVPPGLYIVNQDLLSERNRSGHILLRQLWKTQWDLVIVDEAHHYAHRNQAFYLFRPDDDIRHYDQGLSFSGNGHTLALTATPFALQPQEMVNLLALVRADPNELEEIEKGLRQYVQHLDQFFGLRQRSPTDLLRRAAVESLGRLRDHDALDQGRTGRGLQTLLRRFLIRNVKSQNERRYFLVNRDEHGYHTERFDKLEDLRERVRRAPLLPFDGPDAIFYLALRDVIDETLERDQDGQDQRTFISGDLRQGLSSYRQVAASKLLQRRTKKTRRLVALLDTWNGPPASHLHPKLQAAVDLVTTIARDEIERVRHGRALWLSKVLVFSTLIEGTAPQLREQLADALEPLFEQFLEELAIQAGERSARKMQAHFVRGVRRALRPIHSLTTAWRSIATAERGTDLPEQTDIPSLAYYEDLMVRRAQQPLFMIRALRQGRVNGDAAIEAWITRELVEPVSRSLTQIVRTAVETKEVDQANREAIVLDETLRRVEVAGRYDGANTVDRETHRRNFNEPYYPFVLLVSRVGEEGIDLQEQCRHIIHYDLEWNPARMEQREGRVDRVGYGRKGEHIDVRFLLLKGTYEERIFHTVMQRDQWFQILVGSKRRELGSAESEEANETDELTAGNEATLDAALDRGRLTPEEKAAVMLDLRPASF